MKKKSKIDRYTDQEALDYHNSGKSVKIEILSSINLTHRDERLFCEFSSPSIEMKTHFHSLLKQIFHYYIYSFFILFLLDSIIINSLFSSLIFLILVISKKIKSFSKYLD